MNIWAILSLLLPIFPTIDTIKCLVGYGQRGLKYSNQLQWKRDCPGVNYCFEVVTTDVEKMRRLIDYSWVSDLLSKSITIWIYVWFDVEFVLFSILHSIMRWGFELATRLSPVERSPKIASKNYWSCSCKYNNSSSHHRSRCD